jgi:hypothetical protein
MTSFVVKKGDLYVAYPNGFGFCGSRSDEWTERQMLAWRWVGLESGNGARLAARAIGDGARVVKLKPKIRWGEVNWDDEDPGECATCGTYYELVRPGKSQPNCRCDDAPTPPSSAEKP